MLPASRGRPAPAEPAGRAQANSGAVLLTTCLILSCFATLYCQPRLVTESEGSYQVGDQISPDMFVLDKDLEEWKLVELIRPDAKVVVLVVFGGGLKQIPGGEPFRGTLWCEDSFDDLGVQRAVVQAFKNAPVQFLAIAVPPVYNPTPYGWGKEDFLGEPESSKTYWTAAGEFIEATEKEVQTGLIPFGTVYYDPKFRLAQNKDERKLGPGFGPIYPWQGKLKWDSDPRKYGTPTLWFLSSGGQVLAEPLFGNDYDSDPPEINYGFKEVVELIRVLLEK